MRELIQNLKLITALQADDYRYVTRDANNTLVVCSNPPVKFPKQGEWGVGQTTTLSVNAKPLDSDYFPLVTFEDEEPTMLVDLERAYKLAIRVINDVPEAITILKTLYKNGMQYIVRQPNDDICLFQNIPIRTNTNEWESSNRNEFRTVVSDHFAEGFVFSDVWQDADVATKLSDLLLPYGVLDQE